MTALYTDGTITLANGSAIITGIDTAWKVSNIVGGTLFVEVDGGNSLPILWDDGDGANLHPITDTQMTAAINWTGPSGTYNYAIVRETSYNRQQALNAEKLGDLLSQLDAPLLAALSSVEGLQDHLILLTGPSTLSLIPRSSLLEGVKRDETVNTLAGLATYSGEVKGFAVLVANAGDGRAAIYVKRSNADGDWSEPVYITGAEGDTGNPGPYTEITIGTTTTLPAGSSATVTPTIVDADTIRLDFGLPAGQDGTGTGDVVGPSSSVNNRVAFFDGVTGKLLKDSGITLGNSASRNVGTTAGTVAAGDDARFSQGGSSQNEAILALEIADLKGSRLGMKGGVADAFDDETGVDVKTNAVYDATNDWYVPSIADAATLALLHLDGANGATSIPDDRALRTWSLSGSASISTSQSKFGGASLSFSGGYVSTPTASDLNFGSGDFTIEFWFRPNSVSSNAILLDMRTPANAPVIYITGASVTYYSSANRISSSTLAATNTWMHVALVRGSGVTKLYINGNKEGSDYSDTTSYTSSGIRLGLGNDNTSPFSGFMDEVRISNSARYSSNFTPQTTAFQLLAANMTLRSVAYAASAVPNTGRIAVQLVETDTITINTDLIARISRDGGTTWATAALSLSQSLIGPKIYEATGINLASLGSGTSTKWEVATANNKNVAVSGVVAQWS